MVGSPSPVPVLVLGPPRYVGPLGVMRSLGARGIPVYGLAHRRPSAASVSRFSAGRIAAGDDGRPSADPQRDLEALLDAGRRLGKGTVLIVGSDEWAFFVADHAYELAEWFQFPRVSPSLVRELATKDGLYRLALEHGVPTPRIAFPRSTEEAAAIARELQYPVFMKPVVSRPRGQWKDVAENAESLLANYALMAEPGEDPNVMFQEYIPGRDEDVWMFNGYFDRAGRCLVAFTGQKLRQHPARMGIATFGISRHNDRVVETTVRLLSKLGYWGLVDIGYRFDKRDGQYKVLDINPRLGGAFRLFVDRNGLDVARAMYLDLTGMPVPATRPWEGRLWIKEDADLIALKYYRKLDGLKIRTWLRSVWQADEGATFSIRDPLPFLLSIGSLAHQTVTRRWSRRLRRGGRALRRWVQQRRPAAA
jgi:predicted ATP-grasp superfamily ATP-dependent carboligase